MSQHFPNIVLFPTSSRFLFLLKSNHLLPNRDRHFGFETSEFRDFCQFLRVSVKFGLEKVSVSVSKNLVLKKVSVSENLVWERKNQNNEKETIPSKQCTSLI